MNIKSDFVVAIPARYESSRLAGKSLLEIAGKPMIQWVYERAKESNASEVVIATDEERIENACRAFGAEVCMTSKKHTSGTLRLGEVVEKRGWGDRKVVVNVQGDEPMMPPCLINQVARELLSCERSAMATLMTSITDLKDWQNPNVVKVVTDQLGYALYFSRASIPVDRDAESENRPHVTSSSSSGRHVGIYAYRAGFLREFGQLAPCDYERIESLEQLRALYHGYVIRVGQAECLPGRGVDTAEDLAFVQQCLMTS